MGTVLKEEDTGRGSSYLIISRKTSVESFRIIFARPTIKLALATKSGWREAVGKGWFSGRGRGVCFRFQRLFNDLCLSRAALVLAVCAFNVGRINYHKNARFMRINIVFGRASKRLPDYPYSRNLPRILAVRCFLEGCFNFQSIFFFADSRI